MGKANVKRDDKGTGADFINHQRAMDESLNEQQRMRKENNESGAGSLKEGSHIRDASEKKGGRRSG